jgi:hypothetical protein
MDQIDAAAVRPLKWGGRARGRLSGMVLGLLLSSACGQTGLVEPEAPVASLRSPLEADRTDGLPPEVLEAKVEIYGLPIATLESALCRGERGDLTVATDVDAAPIVKIVKRTSGEARTELLGPSLSPRSSDYTFRDGDMVRHYTVDYRAGGYSYVYDNGGVESRRGSDDVPEGAEVHDLQSAMLRLRAWRPRLGETGYLYVVLGRRPWRVEVTSRGPEMVKVAGDARLSYRIDGVATRLWQPDKASPKHFSLWLSEERERVPLRMVADASFGEVTMTLTKRQTGEVACAKSSVAASSPKPADALIGSAWASPAVTGRDLVGEGGAPTASAP